MNSDSLCNEASDYCGICHRWLDDDGECTICGDDDERRFRALDRALEQLIQNKHENE